MKIGVFWFCEERGFGVEFIREWDYGRHCGLWVRIYLWKPFTIFERG